MPAVIGYRMIPAMCSSVFVHSAKIEGRLIFLESADRIVVTDHGVGVADI